MGEFRLGPPLTGSGVIQKARGLGITGAGGIIEVKVKQDTRVITTGGNNPGGIQIEAGFTTN